MFVKVLQSVIMKGFWTVIFIFRGIMCFKVVSKYFQTYSLINLQTYTTVVWEKKKINKILF